VKGGGGGSRGGRKEEDRGDQEERRTTRLYYHADTIYNSCHYHYPLLPIGVESYCVPSVIDMKPCCEEYPKRLQTFVVEAAAKVLVVLGRGRNNEE